jgi:hypothetical protein
MTNEPHSSKEYVIWCDESIKKGQFYSDFYGGILVRSNHLKEVNDTFFTLKQKLNYPNEVKWQKITSNYLDVYLSFVDALFDLIAADKVKIRIMFRQSAIEPKNLTALQKENSFHLLYYQFIKHAFGLRYSNPSGEEIYLRTYFDKIPDTVEKNELFKNHIYALQSLDGFKNANIRIRREDIVEVDSKKHIELQMLDLVLGAISFRLNDHHLLKEPGKARRGKRTIAKEKVYKRIQQRITEVYPNFNIGITTGKQGGLDSIWSMPYRHWKFMPKEFNINPDKYK